MSRAHRGNAFIERKGGGSSKFNRDEGGGEVKFGKIDIKKGYDSTFSEKRHAETARPTGGKDCTGTCTPEGLRREL